MKNAVKFITGLVLVIFLVPILSTSIVLPIDNSLESKTIAIPPLRGEAPITESELQRNIDDEAKFPESLATTATDNFNQIGRINPKVEGTGVFIEDYVDNMISDVDSSPDLGELTDFSNMQATDISYSNISEISSSGAITKAGTDTTGTGTISPLSFSHTLVSGSNRIILVAAQSEANSANDISATYGGQTMVEAITQTTGTTTTQVLSIFYLLETNLPSNGANTVAISYTGTVTEVNAWCGQWDGVSQATPEATDETVWVSGQTISNTISPSTDAWVISTIGEGNSGCTHTHGQSQVEVYDFSDSSSSFAVAELRGANGELSLDSTITGSINRGVRIAASFQPATGASGYQMDQEVQFENVYESPLVSEELRIKTGSFGGSENINVTYWDGDSWELITSDLTASTWNNFTVTGLPTTEPYFTIKFGGGTTSSDSTQDWWMIDAVLLYVEEHLVITKEDYVDQQSNVDSNSDLGSHSSFNDLRATDSTYDNISEIEAFSSSNTTLIDTESFEGTWLPSGWSETTGSLWNQNSYQPYSGGGTYYAGYYDPSTTTSGNLDSPILNTADASSIFIEFWWRDYALDNNEFLLQLYNGSTWITYQDMNLLTHTENTWTFYSVEITDSQYFDMSFQIRWRSNNVGPGEASGIDLVTVLKSVTSDSSGEWNDWSSELLSNGGFEDGNFGGWTVQGANWAVGADAPSGSAGPQAGSYTAFQTTPSSATDYIYQDVDLTSYSSYITDGRFVVNASGWRVSSEYPAQDLSKIVIQFLDSGLGLISTPLDTGYDDLASWTKEGIYNATVPTNTRYIRIFGYTDEGNTWDSGNVDSFSIKVRTKQANGSNYHLDQEVQFVGVYDSPLLIEQLCIRTGSFGGSENLNVTYWDGDSWELLDSALTASSWNNYTVTLTSPTFTIKFGGSTTSSDSIQDWWEIDSVLLKVETPEEAVGDDSGFVWLDTPDEVDLGTTYNSWVEQDLSDDSVPSSAMGVILGWVEDSTSNLRAVARGADDTNDYMDGGTSYNQMEAETWKMQVVKLRDHRYIDTWRQSSTERLYVMGYTVGEDPQYRRVPAYMGSLTADSTWNTMTVHDIDSDTNGVILFARSRSNQDSTIMVRAVGSTDSMTNREWENHVSGTFFVKLDANDQFEYYITSARLADFYLVAEVKDNIDWLDTNRDSISATSTGWTIRDLDSYVTVPSSTSGVLLQHDSTGGIDDYKNIAREYGQTWTFPDYDVGIDQWMMGGSGIDSENRIQIYAESLEQDVYIHALTLYQDNTPPTIDAFGVEDPGTGTATFWASLTDLSDLDNVTLTVNGTDYQMSFNGSHWTKDLTVNWLGYYTYQITNASDIFGNFLTTSSNMQNYTFAYDTVAPSAIDWEYYQGADGTWDNQNNTFKANVSDSWGEIDTVILEVTTSSQTAMMKEYQDFSGILGFINNTLELDNGGIDFRIIVNDTSGNEITSSIHSDSVFYNHPPTASNLALNTDPYYSNTSLILSYSYSDPDSHPQSGTEIRWYKNGILQGVHNNSVSINPSYLFTGDQWNATVKPKDGTLFGEINISSTITISNTPPTPTDVIILPNNPVTSSTLIVDFNYYDYDGDSENTGYRQIEWYKVGTGHLGTFDNQTSLSSSNTVKGEQYYVRIRVFDGESYSVWLTSPIITIGNSIPNAVNLSLPTNPTNTTDLIASWEMQDADIGDVENTSAVIIYWYKNGVLQPLWNNSVIIGAGNTTKGQIWWFKIQVFDGENYSSLTELLPHVEIVNAIPVVTDVSIVISTPYTTDDLVTDAWTFTDADNDGEGTPIIRWYRNNILQSAYNGYTTLPASVTAKGENWHFGVQVYDGSAYSLQVNSSQVLIQNTVPDVDNLTLTSIPTTTDDLLASWTYTDEDLDGLSFNITWYLNNVYNSSWITATNSATLNAGNTSKYQQWYYTIRAYDDDDYSTLISLGSNITIQNSIPTTSYANFTTLNPSTVDDFNLTYGFVDNDGDLEFANDIIVYWYVNWAYQSQYENQTSIYSDNTTTGEIWYYIIRVFDGEGYSDNVTSDTGVIIGGGLNFKPTAENLTLTPIFPLTSDDLIADYDYSDPENNDEIAFEIQWFMDGVLQEDYQTLTLPASATSKNQQWNFTIRVFDGLQWSDLNNSQVYTIGNTAPGVSGIDATSDPTTSNDLFVSWSSSDQDSDTLTFNVTWILDGTKNSSLLTSDHFAILGAGNTTKGDNWNITIEAYDGDGGYSTILTLGTTISIINTNPLAENLTLNLLPKTGDDLTANWDFFDIDNDLEDTDGTIIFWYKNGDLQASWTNSTTIGFGNTSKGQVWWYKIQVYDGEQYSTLTEFLPHIEIQNTAPVNVSILPLPTSPSVESEIDLTLSSVLSSFTDADGDSIELVELRWYKNGVLQVNLNDSLSISGSKLARGDNWSYTTIVSDGLEFAVLSQSSEFQILNSLPNLLGAYFTEAGVKTIHNLTANYLYEDADGDVINVFEIRWYRSTSPYIAYTLNPAYDGYLSLPYTATTKNERWKFNITLSDGFNASTWVLSDYIAIENSIPWIDPYSIVLTGGLTTSDPLNVTFMWYDDDPGDVQSGTSFRWDGPFVTNPSSNRVLNSSVTKAGETWSVRITPGDGTDLGDVVESKLYGISIIIGNTPPEIPGNEIKIQGYDPINGSYSDGVAFGSNVDLIVRYNVSDVDGLQGVSAYDVFLVDGYAYGSQYRWFRNRSGVVTLIPALNGMTTVPSSFIQRDDLWWVEVTPRDLYGDFGVSQNSTEISITNSAPYLASLSWTQSAFYASDDLSFDYVFADRDLTDVEYGSIIEWYLNGINQSDFHSFVSISFQNTSKGDVWYARIRVWDGDLYSNWFSLPNITILNTDPIASNILLTPASPTATQNLTVNWDYSDYDNDGQQSPRIRWYRNNILQVILNDVTTVNASYLNRNDFWYVTVEAFDGENYSILITSSSITVINSPPTLKNVVLWNNNDLSNTSYTDGVIIILDLDYVDDDGDLLDTGSTSIQWYRNGAHLPLFDNQTSISSGELQKGDSWYAIVQVLDLGGTVWSDNLTSQTITVINKAPEVTSLTFLEEPGYLLENENISLILIIFDPDVNDTDSSLIEWMINGTLQPQYTDLRVISFSDTNPGENWTVIITPSDGVDYGSIVSRSIIIESVPYIQNLTAIIEQDSDGHFTFGVQVLDALHDISSVEYEVLLNGTVLDFEDIVNSPNATDYWLLDYTLSAPDYYNTKALIVINAISTRGIRSTRSFNFTIIDGVAPRISESGLGVWFVKDKDDPTNLTFYADIEEYGSGIANVTLYYYYNPDEAGDGASALQEFTEVLMTLENSFDGTFRYSITVPYPQDDLDYEILYLVSTQDMEGNSDPAAFDIHDYPDRISNEKVVQITAGGLPEYVLYVAGAAVFLIFVGSIVYVRFIRKPELVGLDKELVMKTQKKIREEDISASIEEHSIGIIVSFFAQRQGPIPIIVFPEVLKDNFTKLIEISDRSFNNCGFANTFDRQIASSFDIDLTDTLSVRSMSFGFALNRPEARGGKENLTLNILLFEGMFSILNHFQMEIQARVRTIHKLMDVKPGAKDEIRQRIYNLRRYVSSIILAYQEIYGLEPPVMEMPDILGFDG